MTSLPPQKKPPAPIRMPTNPGNVTKPGQVPLPPVPVRPPTPVVPKPTPVPTPVVPKPTPVAPPTPPTPVYKSPDDTGFVDPRFRYSDPGQVATVPFPKNPTPPAVSANQVNPPMPLKKGGKVMSASKRADGIAQRGKTRGKMY